MEEVGPEVNTEGWGGFAGLERANGNMADPVQKQYSGQCLEDLEDQVTLETISAHLCRGRRVQEKWFT